MTTLTNYRIGLIALPALAAVLTEAGAQVIGDQDFRTAARQINEEVRAHGAFPLIISDEAVPGTGPWLEKTLRSTTAVLVQTDSGSAKGRVGGNTQDAPRLAAPIDVSAILEAVGLPTPASLSQVTLLADGSISRTEGQSPRPDEREIDPPAGLTEAVARVPRAASGPADELHPVHGDEATIAPTVTPPAWPGFRQDSDDDEVKSGSERLPAQMADADPSPRPGAETHAHPPAWPAIATPATRPALPRAEAQNLSVSSPMTEDPAPIQRPLAKVIYTFAGKGGVGKTSMAMFLAQRAAEKAQLRVVLIDGNRGQGDTRTFLSLSRAALPTVYDIATGADPSSVILTPTQLAANRRPGASQLLFALMMAPPAGMSNPEIVTAETYSDALSAARREADLVIVDTQISEDSDTSTLFDDLWIPSLMSHAWGLGIADLSTPGVNNLLERLALFSRRGIGTTRIATVLNRVPATLTFDEQSTGTELARYGRFLGRITSDDSVIAETDHGNLPVHKPEISTVLDQLLFQVTALEAFAPVPEELLPAAPAKRSWWRR